jgi:ABC-2 type transport system ATP-binding protein
MTPRNSIPEIRATHRVLARLHAAHKRYDSTHALAGVDLEIRAGEVLALLGANGAGKTTALGLLTGRITPDAGTAELLGGDPRDPMRRRGIGVMLQETSLPDTLRVAEHVRLHSSYYPQPRALDETLALARIEDLARRRYADLSGGQQRRVQFALAICGRAPLLFVDEPSAGLDVDARRALWQVLRTLRTEGAGIVLTTHYLEEADALAERVVVLAQGRVIAQDTPTGIKALAAGKRVRARTALGLAQIAAWPECEAAELRDATIEVRSCAPEALLRRWLAHDAGLDSLEVLPLSLEEAFVSLTAARPTAHEEMAA